MKKKGETKFALDSDEEDMYLDYQPTYPDLLDWHSLKHKDDFAVKIFKNSAYVGQLDQNMKRCGRGVIRYESGRIYEGSWQDDVRHGQGFEHFANGSQYLGEYKLGKVSGQGKYTWLSGMFYDGEWENG